MSDGHFIRVSCFTWVDVPTPLGPDMQVRQVRIAEHATSVLEWRVRPSADELEAQGISREEANRWPSEVDLERPVLEGADDV